MADLYQEFLRAPSASHLASNAALHYITTTTSISQPEAIIKHLQAQRKQVETVTQKVLSCLETRNGVCLEVEARFKFINGGGIILPQLDSNMIADMEATCPMVHMVQLDGNGKISQIRIYWDQATMLRQVEAIGKSGRNWPIREGANQVELVQQSLAAQASQVPNYPSASRADETQSSRQQDDYTSRLFKTGHEDMTRRNDHGDSVPIRESARPQQRNYNELFPDGTSRQSPQNMNAKIGAGQNFKPNRLFNADDYTVRQESPERKPADPRRYEHFDMSQGDDRPSHSMRSTATAAANNQTSHWQLDPPQSAEKVARRPNPEQERHFGYDIDEPQKTPYKQPIKHQPRPDAQTHFAIEDRSPGDAKMPLQNNTNINNARRKQDMNGHFEISQQEPSKTSAEDARGGSQNDQNRFNSNNMNSKRSEMESSLFSQYQEPPRTEPKIYKTAGDGMGGRAGARSWDFGDAESAPAEKQYGSRGREKQVYKTAGNGMGGRKDMASSWMIGGP